MSFSRNALAFWLGVGVVGFLCVPWYALDASVLSTAWLRDFTGKGNAPALIQVWRHGRTWLLPSGALLLASAPAAVAPPRPRCTRLCAAGPWGDRLPVHARPGLRHRRAGLVLRRSDPRVGALGRRSVRHGSRSSADALGVRNAVRPRSCGARLFQRRCVHCRQHRGDPCLDCDIHLLPGTQHSRERVPGRWRSILAERIHRPRDAAESLGPRLHYRRSALRRRLEHAPARADLRRGHDRPRPCLRAGGRAHKLPLQEAAARDVDPADHHAAVRHRPRTDTAVRALRRAQ